MPGRTTTTETAWACSGAVAEPSFSAAREASSWPQPAIRSAAKPTKTVLRKRTRGMGSEFSGCGREGKPIQATRLWGEKQLRFRSLQLPRGESVHSDELAPTDGQDGE